jgi:hypothetical protein
VANVQEYVEAGPLLCWLDAHPWAAGEVFGEDPDRVHRTLRKAISTARLSGVFTVRAADKIACAIGTHLSVIYGADYWRWPL